MHQQNALSKLGKITEQAPAAMKAFIAFDQAALAAGALDVKTKELIALAVAHTTQCIYRGLSPPFRATRELGAFGRDRLR